MLNPTPLPHALMDRIAQNQVAKDLSTDDAVRDWHSDQLCDLREAFADYLDGIGVNADAFFKGLN